MRYHQLDSNRAYEWRFAYTKKGMYVPISCWWNGYHGFGFCVEDRPEYGLEELWQFRSAMPTRCRQAYNNALAKLRGEACAKLYLERYGKEGVTAC